VVAIAMMVAKVAVTVRLRLASVVVVVLW
jgi:hypothetical protein